MADQRHYHRPPLLSFCFRSEPTPRIGTKVSRQHDCWRGILSTSSRRGGSNYGERSRQGKAMATADEYLSDLSRYIAAPVQPGVGRDTSLVPLSWSRRHRQPTGLPHRGQKGTQGETQATLMWSQSPNRRRIAQGRPWPALRCCQTVVGSSLVWERRKRDKVGVLREVRPALGTHPSFHTCPSLPRIVVMQDTIRWHVS